MIEKADEGGVRSVRRALRTLDLLVGAAPTPVRVADVAAHLEVTSATASRILSTLVEGGYATRTAQRRFTLGPRSMPLATRWMARLQAIAAGPMARVSETTGETTTVTYLSGRHEVPVAVIPSRDPEKARRVTDVGRPVPWATASGRALLAGLPPEQRSRLLPPEPYPRLTTHTMTCWSDLRYAIRSGARDGLFTEEGGLHADMWCCSVPLEPSEAGDVLALAVVFVGEPTGREQARIHTAMRREACRVRFLLATP